MAIKVGTYFKKRVALVIFVCHAALAIFFYTKGTQNDSYYWGGAVVIVASLPYLSAIIKYNFIAYEAIYIYLAVFLSFYVGNMFSAVPFSMQVDLYRWAYGMQLVFIGLIALLIGYWVRLGRFLAYKLSLKNFLITDEKLIRLPLLLYPLGYGLRIIFFLFNFGQGAGWQIIAILVHNSISTALMVDAYLYFSPFTQQALHKNKKASLARFLIFLPVELIFGFLSGMRENIFFPVLLIFLVFMKAKKKIPYIFITIFLFIFMAYVMPIMGLMRREGSDLRYAATQVFHGDRETNITKSTERVTNSIGMLLYCIEKREEGLRIKTHQSVFDYLSRFVPRFIWTDKPSVDYNKIGKELGILNEDDNTTSINLPMLVSFFLNDGTIGIVLGMFFVGVILRVWWHWLVVRSGENFLTFIIYLNLVYMWLRDQEFFVTLHASIGYLIYTYFLLGIVNKGRMPKSYMRDFRQVKART